MSRSDALDGVIHRLSADVEKALSDHGYVAYRGRFELRRAADVAVIELEFAERTAPGLVFVRPLLGVYYSAISRHLGRVVAHPRQRVCHWRRNLGLVTPALEDRWWAVTDTPQAQTNPLYGGPATDVQGVLATHGVPSLEAHLDRAIARTEWDREADPMLGETTTRLYLAALIADAGESELAREILGTVEVSVPEPLSTLRRSLADEVDTVRATTC